MDCCLKITTALSNKLLSHELFYESDWSFQKEEKSVTRASLNNILLSLKEKKLMNELRTMLFIPTTLNSY